MTDTDTKDVSPRKSVLIVEDDLFLIQACKLKFAKENVDVWIAADGLEARAYLEKDPPNVVVLDLVLPGRNGFEVLEAIRKNERWMNVPIIVLTNLESPADIERGQALKVTDYITKSDTRIDEVVSRVKKYL